jgi:hypothetical protein
VKSGPLLAMLEVCWTYSCTACAASQLVAQHPLLQLIEVVCGGAETISMFSRWCMQAVASCSVGLTWLQLIDEFLDYDLGEITTPDSQADIELRMRVGDPINLMCSYLAHATAYCIRMPDDLTCNLAVLFQPTARAEVLLRLCNL